jgi:hypothetical protein
LCDDEIAHEISFTYLLIYPRTIVVESVPAAPDMTAYYADFWLYASYYGEPAARTYYTQWSPPEGTPAPPGTVLPGTVQTPIVEVTAEANKVDDDNSKETTSNPTITDPEIAAAYEKYKIEVCAFLLLCDNQIFLSSIFLMHVCVCEYIIQSPIQFYTHPFPLIPLL